MLMKRAIVLPALVMTVALLCAFAACIGGPEAGEEEELSGESRWTLPHWENTVKRHSLN
jgi:hypothetical protein